MSRQALIRSNVGKNMKQHRVWIPHCVRSSYEGHSLSFHLTLMTTTGKKIIAGATEMMGIMKSLGKVLT